MPILDHPVKILQNIYLLHKSGKFLETAHIIIDRDIVLIEGDVKREDQAGAGSQFGLRLTEFTRAKIILQDSRKLAGVIILDLVGIIDHNNIIAGHQTGQVDLVIIKEDILSGFGTVNNSGIAGKAFRIQRFA